MPLLVGARSRAMLLPFALARSKSAGHDGPLLYRGPSEAAVGRRKAPQGWSAWMPTSFSPAHGDGMDAGVEATQEQLPDGLSKNPAARPRTGQTGCLTGAKAGWPFSLVTFSLLRASCPTPFGPAALFACASCACVATQRESNSPSEGGRNAFDLALASKHRPRAGSYKMSAGSDTGRGFTDVGRCPTCGGGHEIQLPPQDNTPANTYIPHSHMEFRA